MARRSTSSRDLLWRALLHGAGARWRSLAKLELPRRSRSSHPEDPALTLVRALQAQARRRMPAVARGGTKRAEAESLPGSIALTVAIAFQHLGLAEQQLLLGDRPTARLHGRQFLHGLLSAAVAVLGEGFTREEEELLQTTALPLPERLATQLELRQALAAGSLPGRMIFVLGMHRSGTSALSGMLCQAGFDAPADLMPADAVNPRGYWESRGLFALNEDLLRDLGSRWDDPEPLPQGWQDGEEGIRWRAGVLRHLSQVFAGASAALIKDPRLCLLLSGLSPWLESGALRVEMLLTLRHPLEVARSLEQAQNLPSQEGLGLWLRHVFTAERISRGWPRLLLPFEDLIDQPESSLNRCLALLSSGRTDPGLEQQASRFVRPELHRQRRQNLEEELRRGTRSIVTTRELALTVHDLLKQEDLDAPTTTARLDALAAHWRLLPERSQALTSRI